MADISVTPKQSGGTKWALVLVTIVLVIALMVWLDRQEGTTAMAPVVQEDTTTAVTEDPVPAAADTAGAADDTTAAVQP